MARIKLAYPIAEAHGYLDREKDADGKTFGGFGVTCTATGRQVSFHHKNKRNTALHPVTNDEKTRRSTFAAIAKKVAARRKSNSATFAQDMAAYMAQRDQPGGIGSFVKWLWADEQSKM